MQTTVRFANEKLANCKSERGERFNTGNNSRAMKALVYANDVFAAFLALSVKGSMRAKQRKNACGLARNFNLSE